MSRWACVCSDAWMRCAVRCLRVKSWRFTEGGTDSRAIARVGHGGGLGYSFRSQPHVCFCGRQPCMHGIFTGEPTEHTVLPSTQERTDREQATSFINGIKDSKKIDIIQI